MKYVVTIASAVFIFAGRKTSADTKSYTSIPSDSASDQFSPRPLTWELFRYTVSSSLASGAHETLLIEYYKATPREHELETRSAMRWREHQLTAGIAPSKSAHEPALIQTESSESVQGSPKGKTSALISFQHQNT